MGYLHANANNGRGAIPKAEVISSFRRRIPRHDNHIEVDEDIKEDCYIPSPERSAWEIGFPVPPADKVDTHRHEYIEDSVRIDLKTDNCEE